MTVISGKKSTTIFFSKFSELLPMLPKLTNSILGVFLMHVNQIALLFNFDYRKAFS